MPTSLGAHAPRLATVRDLLTKAGRRTQGRFLIEGPTMLAEALRSHTPIDEVYATAGAYDALGPLAGYLTAPVFVVPDRSMARLSDVETPPGIVAVVPTALTPLGALLDGRGPLMLLAALADPGNVGTLLRSAEIFGFGGVILGLDGVEPYNPKVVRASMGAILRLPLAVTGAADLVRMAGTANYMLIATGREGIPLAQFRFRRRSIIAVGHERRGVAGWLPRHDQSVAIPQYGPGESLNAAIAGSIVAYAAAEQLGGDETAAEVAEKP